jgi:hypothetical protein
LGDYWQDVARDFNAMMARLAVDHSRAPKSGEAPRPQEEPAHV